MKIFRLSLALIASSTLLWACNSNKSNHNTTAEATVLKSTNKTTTYSQANFSLEIPETWIEEEPSSSMRITQFALKSSPEHKIVVSYFGNNENMVKANIERWKKQFTIQDSYENLVLTNEDITGIKILGTFQLKTFPMAKEYTNTPDYGILAAIVPSNKGPYFFKLTAPKEIINNEVSNFTAALNSYR